MSSSGGVRDRSHHHKPKKVTTMKSETAKETPTVYRTTLRVDRFIKQVFDEHFGDDENEHEKMIIGDTLVFLGLATFDLAEVRNKNVKTICRCFKSTKTLRLLMDREGLFIPYPGHEAD
jgi:hypothetical protein